MTQFISSLLDKLSEFLAHRKGLLPIVGIALVIANLALQFIAPTHWITSSDLLLHLGVLIAIFGLILAWAL